MGLPPDVVQDVAEGLALVEDQLHRLLQLIDTEHDCRELVEHIAAAAHAVRHAGFKVVAAGIDSCAKWSSPDGGGAEPAEIAHLLHELA